MQTWRFQLPRGTGKKSVSCASIHIREVNGKDEEQASVLAEAKGKSGSVALELLRLSIVKVDDQPVSQPFGGLETWNSRTRKFALDAWSSINSVSEDETEGFLESAQVEVDGGATIVAISSERG
jgi:hypothetical protein